MFLAHLPLWGFFVLTVVIVLAGIECGYQLAVFLRKRRKPEDHEIVSKAPVGAIVQSTLALVAFVIAFTFGAAGERFEQRRELLIQEANAIETTYLRTDFLPASNRQEIQNLLRRYVELRVQPDRDEKRFEHALAESNAMQDAMWKQVVAAGKANMDSEIVSLFIESLNETFDLQTKRLMAYRARMPDKLWVSLFLVIFVGMIGTGYQCGCSGARSWTATWALVAAFAIIMNIIADLDNPAEGSLSANNQPLINLSKKIGPPQ